MRGLSCALLGLLVACSLLSQSRAADAFTCSAQPTGDKVTKQGRSDAIIFGDNCQSIAIGHVTSFLGTCVPSDGHVWSIEEIHPDDNSEDGKLVHKCTYRYSDAACTKMTGDVILTPADVWGSENASCVQIATNTYILETVDNTTAFSEPEVQGEGTVTLQFYSTYKECQVALAADPTAAWDSARLLQLNKYAVFTQGCMPLAPLWQSPGYSTFTCQTGSAGNGAGALNLNLYGASNDTCPDAFNSTVSPKSFPPMFCSEMQGRWAMNSCSSISEVPVDQRPTTCSAGTYSASGSAPCVDCPSGKISTGGSAACTDCPQNSYNPRDGMSTCSECAGAGVGCFTCDGADSQCSPSSGTGKKSAPESKQPILYIILGAAVGFVLVLAALKLYSQGAAEKPQVEAKPGAAKNPIFDSSPAPAPAVKVLVPVP